MALQIESQSGLEEILTLALRKERFEVAYQPIYSVGETVPCAYEALLRPEARISPSLVLGLARRLNLLGQLEVKVLQRVLSDSAAMPPKRTIFVNASREALSSVKWLDTLRCFSHGIVVEVQDRNLWPADLNLLARLKDAGIGVAFDDLGQTFDDFDALELVRPQYVKSDRSLVRDNHQDTIRQIAEIARGAGAALIVEGIETEEEARAVGPDADFVQGFFYGMPCSIREVV